MKTSILAILMTTFAVASAFAPSAPSSAQKSTVVMLHATEPTTNRKAFFSAAALSILAATAASSPPAHAGSMAQEYVADPTEQWETGAPTPAAKKARKERFTNARSQLTSSFPPIKRLTLERKSPVTRLDINAPGFDAYKKTYPGLFK